MSLYKLPFIVVGTWFANASGTPPFPPVKDEELRILKARFVAPIGKAYKVSLLEGQLKTPYPLLT